MRRLDGFGEQLRELVELALAEDGGKFRVDGLGDRASRVKHLEPLAGVEHFLGSAVGRIRAALNEPELFEFGDQLADGGTRDPFGASNIHDPAAIEAEMDENPIVYGPQALVPERTSTFDTCRGHPFAEVDGVALKRVGDECFDITISRRGGPARL